MADRNQFKLNLDKARVEKLRIPRKKVQQSLKLPKLVDDISLFPTYTVDEDILIREDGHN